MCGFLVPIKLYTMRLVQIEIIEIKNLTKLGNHQFILASLPNKGAVKVKLYKGGKNNFLIVTRNFI